MAEISRKDAIEELDSLFMYVEHAFTKEHKNCSINALKKAISDIEKLEKIEQIILDTNCLRPMEKDFADGFKIIEQIVKG